MSFVAVGIGMGGAAAIAETGGNAAKAITEAENAGIA